MKGIRVLLLGCALVASAQGPLVYAQAFPAKPIELVVHTGAGGGADLFARQVADIIQREKILPQPFVISNRAGGGGAIALNYTASKRGDPYVVLSVTAGLVLSVPLRSGLDLGTDKVQPIALMGYDLCAITVRGDSPYKTIKDLVDAARANPKAVSIAHGSIGGTSHYLPFMVQKMSGVTFTMVSMKSGAEAVTSVLGGHLQATTEQISEMIPYLESGQMRVLAIASLQRVPSLPNVPTLRESGMDLHVGAGRGFYLPGGVPSAAATTLEAAFERVYKSAPWQDYMKRNLYEPLFLNSAAFTRHQQEQQPKITQYITELGLINKP